MYIGKENTTYFRGTIDEVTDHTSGSINEQPNEKTNNVVSEQVRHKPSCTVTEADKKLEISNLTRRGILLSEYLWAY